VKHLPRFVEGVLIGEKMRSFSQNVRIAGVNSFRYQISDTRDAMQKLCRLLGPSVHLFSAVESATEYTHSIYQNRLVGWDIFSQTMIAICAPHWLSLFLNLQNGSSTAPFLPPIKGECWNECEYEGGRIIRFYHLLFATKDIISIAFDF
jgi:hypothetical protein